MGSELNVSAVRCRRSRNEAESCRARCARREFRPRCARESLPKRAASAPQAREATIEVAEKSPPPQRIILHC